MVRFEVKGKDMQRKKVARAAGCGHIYLPKEWVGHEIMVILDPEDD